MSYRRPPLAPPAGNGDPLPPNTVRELTTKVDFAIEDLIQLVTDAGILLEADGPVTSISINNDRVFVRQQLDPNAQTATEKPDGRGPQTGAEP